MKNKELYDKTVSILVDAYMNDTLQHGNYCGCAVGNMIASNMGIQINNILKEDEDSEIEWIGVSDTDASQWLWLIYKDKSCLINERLALRQIRSTGYSVEEIYKIEKAFEGSDRYYEEDEMFSGLMAVIEALDIIHENTDTTLTNQTKKRFHKNETCKV